MSTKQRFLARDLMSLTSRIVTEEGYIVAPGRLARTGVQTYRAYELGLDAQGLDPMKVIRLHRPPEEVFNAASMASFENKPVTIDHPTVNVTADNWEELAKGEVRNIVQSGEWLDGQLIIKSREAVDAMQEGKVELSNGYTFELDLTPGTTADGQPYDGVQRNIRGNHVALVDAARCGSACRIADSQPTQQGVNTMAVRKVTIDGIPFEMEEAAAAAVDKLNQAVIKAQAETKAANDALAAAKTEHDTAMQAKDAELESLKKDVMTPDARDAMVAEWGKTIGDAKRLVPELVTDGKTCLAIRREVITSVTGQDATAKAIAEAVLAGKTVDAADADTVRAAFNALAAAVRTEGNDAAVGDADTTVADALAGGGKANPDEPVLVGRDKFLSRSFH
jgi:hypothetical protein